MGDMSNSVDGSAGSKIFVGGLDRSVDEGDRSTPSWSPFPARTSFFPFKALIANLNIFISR